jgi:hypothetical protein
MSNRSPHTLNRVSAKCFWILKIRGWRLDAQTSRLASVERIFAVAETDIHVSKKRKSRVFSQNTEMPRRDGTGWLGMKDSNWRMSVSKPAKGNSAYSIVENTSVTNGAV